MSEEKTTETRKAEQGSNSELNLLLAADIRNKLSPIKTFLQIAYDERLPIELRTEARKRAFDSLEYVEHITQP